MANKRFKYFITVLLIIALGILSRKTAFIPLFFGDILYAMMIYFILRFFFIKYSSFKIAIVSLLLCYLIELSQLYQTSWINDVRNSLFGHYILGQGFLWSDLVAYAFGILFAFLMNKKVIL